MSADGMTLVRLMAGLAFDTGLRIRPSRESRREIRSANGPHARRFDRSSRSGESTSLHNVRIEPWRAKRAL
ncbi:MAG: hypothetical protein RMI91_04370 [Gemmatales bacterium]|nr:hypothetical protein [Gemmatales bacterium]MDW7993870.1 hypothetical protein [Gemmatales bacterium]